MEGQKKDHTIRTYLLGVIFLALLAFLGSVILDGSFQLGSGNSERIDVVALLPLSGNAQTTGENIRDAIEFAVSEIHEDSPTQVFSVTYMDTQTDPDLAAEQFAAITEETDLVISALSSVGARLGPLADDRGIPLFMLTTSAPSVTKGRSCVYRYWPTAKEQVGPIMPILAERDIKSLHLLVQDDEFGESVKDALKDLSEDLNLTFTFELFDLAEGPDPVPSDILASVDAVYVSGFASVTAPIIADLGARYDGMILTSAGVTSEEFRSTFPRREYIGTAPLIFNPNYVFSAPAQRRFEEVYGRRMDQTTATAYDLMYMIESSVFGGRVTRASIKQRFNRGFTYPSIFGSVVVEEGDPDISYQLQPIIYNDLGIEYVF